MTFSNEPVSTPADPANHGSDVPLVVVADPLETMLAETDRLISTIGEYNGSNLDDAILDDVLERAQIWGIPLARLTYEQVLDRVDRLVERGRPGFFITANLHYAMLTDRDDRLKAANRRAALITADGMPMVWYSRLIGKPLPGRVTGADLIWRLAERAQQRDHSIYLLGGMNGVAAQAAEIFTRRFPGLRIVGVEEPVLGGLSAAEHGELVARIRRAGPDLLLVAFGQPKGELWLAENCEALGVPACVQLGASFDFVAGRIRRAPAWAQRIGAEWLYRISREPRRLTPRYLKDGLFLAKAIFCDVTSSLKRCFAHRRPADTHR